MKCVVVGGGVIGTCVALRLAQRGVDVTLVDAGAPGAGTSGTSFAWIGASAPALRPYFDLNAAGVGAYRRLRAELGEAPWLVDTGCLTWYTDPSQQAALSADLDALGALGYSAATLPPGRVADLEPDVQVAAGVEAVAFFPDEGYLQAGPMIGHLLRAARSLGATVLENSEVVALETAGSRVTGVRLSSGESVEADRVVLCCGRWSESVAALAGANLPLCPLTPQGSDAVGLVVLTRPFSGRLRRIVLSDGVIVRPDGGGRLLLHGDLHDRLVTAETPNVPAPAAAEALVEAAQPLLPVASLALEAARVCFRPLPADRLPVVGHLRETEGVYAVVTHSGVTLAAILGELVAAEIATEEEEDCLAAFRPDRFAVHAVPDA